MRSNGGAASDMIVLLYTDTTPGGKEDIGIGAFPPRQTAARAKRFEACRRDMKQQQQLIRVGVVSLESQGCSQVSVES